MKVVILCGGMGTRLREETEYKPKPMVQVCGRPILWHIMKNYAHYGFKDFMLCLGYRQEVIREYFLNYRHMNREVTVNLSNGEMVVDDNEPTEDWRVALVDTGLETKKGSRLLRAAHHLVDGPFMLTYGDGVGDIDIPALLNCHRNAGKLATFTGVHPISRFATVETDDQGQITGWAEKKKLEAYINAGFFVLQPEVLDYLNDDCELEEEPMAQLAREGQLNMYHHEGFWHCMDTYRDYLMLQSMCGDGHTPWQVWGKLGSRP